MRSTLKFFAAVGTAALLAACGGDKDKNITGTDTDPGPGPGGNVGSLGSFTGASSGELSLALAGSAVFGRASEGLAADGFELGLGAFTTTGGTGTPGSVVFFRAQDALPAAGTYEIFDATSGETPDDAQFSVGLRLRPAGESLGYFCQGTGGTLTVTSVSATRIKGSFSVQSACSRTGSSEEVAVSTTGQFDAAKGIQSIPTN
jgi:hypothetical protein